MRNYLFKQGCLILFAVFALVNTSYAVQTTVNATDEKPVSGLVTDVSGRPVTGATVQVKGTSVYAITDDDGKFEIDAGKNAVLVTTFLGYTTSEKKLSSQKFVTIILQEQAQLLNDVVVVGYGTQKKANLTGAVDQVNGDAFKGRSNANMVQMLQGAIPNLNIKLTDGKPSRSASFNIRGTTSIGQGGSALVLIDGVEGDPSLLNPNDVASVSVLKDAASSAIYGSRAPYGVVLITTKSGEKGTPRVNYSATLSLQSPTNIPKVVSDGYTWAEHFYTAWSDYKHYDPSGINKTMRFSAAWLQEYKKRKENGNFGTEVSDGSLGIPAGNWLYFNDHTNYVSMLYKNHVFTQNHNLSISGSGGKFSYYLSGRFYDYGGLFNSPDNTDNYKIFNSRVKMSYQVKSWLKLTDNITVGRSNYKNPVTYTEGSGNVWRNLADEGHPSSPIWNPDGTMSYSAVYSTGDFLYGNSYRKYKKINSENTIGAEMSFFNDKLHVYGDFTYKNNDYFRTIKRVRTPYSRTKGVTETISGTQSYISELTQNTGYITTNEYASYENTFAKKHYFKALLGYNYEQSQMKNLYAYNDDLLTEDVENINLAMGDDNKNITGKWNKWRSAGAFFRFNYIYDNRYLLEINGRYDGSSKFPSDEQWAFFPSISAGWRVSSEPWFKIDPKFLSNVKIRASYGSLGNSNISSYSYDEKFSINSGPIINGQKVRYTSSPSPIPSGLTWETARTMNMGVDLSALKGRLSITADWYRRKTLDMYIVGPTLPDVYGASSPKGNYGDMSTKGYEISIAWNDTFHLNNKPFNYSVRATISDYTSIIDKYNNSTKYLGNHNSPNYYSGMKVGEIWGFVCNGLFQNEQEVAAAEASAKAAGQSYYYPIMQTDNKYKLYPGDVKFEDLNGNGYLDRGANTVDDPGDRKIIGNSEPRYIFSFNFSADWNNFFFSAFFNGVGKQDWYPGSEASFFWGQYNRPYNQMMKWQTGKYWTEENTKAYLPRYTGYYAPFFRGNYFANTRYLQNVAYVRLKNIQFGYTLPGKLVKKAGLEKVDLYFSGDNLWTWSPLYRRTKNIDVTNIYGSDADLDSSVGNGYNYPTMKSLSLGINITF